ncbi:MAG: hypothetical protein E6Q90_05250 [Actinobacteria bacterium]|nr:MAG: hypothetical protein E6Q90_05250 [Actinomycetota bacterium]
MNRNLRRLEPYSSSRGCSPNLWPERRWTTAPCPPRQRRPQPRAPIPAGRRPSVVSRPEPSTM